jgi:Protein of unknown function (DUF2505)
MRYTRDMKTVTGTALLPCSAESFWKTFLDERYTRSLFLDELQFSDFAVLELTDHSRKIRLQPKLPGVLQKLAGDSFAYEEHGTLDRARNEWTWRMIPKKAIVATHGSVRIEPTPDGNCRRHDQVVIEGKLFGVGGLIESSAEKEVRSSFAKELVFFKRWLEKPRDV